MDSASSLLGFHILTFPPLCQRYKMTVALLTSSTALSPLPVTAGLLNPRADLWFPGRGGGKAEGHQTTAASRQGRLGTWVRPQPVL